MKKNLLYTICFVAFAISALPMSANDYLKIYFKDGHTERHYMHLVESISATKYDLDGNLHTDYQMQQIVMPDTTYSYYLADIDSMAFRKVDEEQVKERVETVQSSLEQISQQSSNIEDLASYVDEIKRIDGVEEVYYDGNDLFIQIRDWYVVSVLRQPIPENIVSSANTLGRNNIRHLMPTTNDGSPMKVTIGFQMKDDYNFVDGKVAINLLNTKFSIMGYNPNYELGDELDFDFFKKRIFDSNVVLIDTHGGCGIFNKKHYLYTGIESSSNDLVGLSVDQWFDISKNIDIDDIGISLCNYAGGNLFNNPFGLRWYFTVTEDYIRKSPYRFTGTGPHIVFVAACSSLQGNDILTRSDGKQYYGSDSFAQVFFEKGADVYLGYNHGTYRSSFAADNFLDYMLHGASVEQAFNTLHPLYKYEEDKEEKAALIDLYNQKSNNPKGIFIVNTHTETKTDQDLNKEFVNKQQVELGGTTFCWDLNEVHPNFGFRIATEPNINENTNSVDILSNDFHYTGEKYKEVAFSGVFKPEPGITYYYRAFTYDDIHYNWGEERHFIVYNDLSVSAETITLKVRETSTIQVTAGSGQYGVTNLNSEIAIATLQGTTISINGVSEGKAQVVVTDILTGKKAIIEITVKDPNQAGQIMMERRYLVNTVNDYYNNSFYNPERFSYQESVINLSNGIYIAVRYHNANYWEGTYDKSHLGVFLAVGTNESTEEEWYISPLVKNEWISEKIVIDCDGTIQYYMNGINMGTHQFSQLDLENVNSLTLSFNPYGWWYTHYHYMDDFKISTPATTISDSFDDGVINPDIWKQPANPDGVREEDGIMKTEQLRTDKDFVLRSKLIPIFDSDTNVGGLVKEVEGANYRLYKKLLDPNDVHVNADGWRFFRTQLLLDVTKDSKKKTYEVGELYMPDDDDVAMCMLFDLNNRKAIVFANSKTSAKNYSMDGYAYVSSLDNLSFTKETVFSSQNWGWMPYFVDSGNQQYILKHFSFNGYYQMQSKRSTDGTWTNGKLGSMSPDQSQKNWEASDRMLVVGSTPTY